MAVGDQQPQSSTTGLLVETSLAPASNSGQQCQVMTGLVSKALNIKTLCPAQFHFLPKIVLSFIESVFESTLC